MTPPLRLTARGSGEDGHRFDVEIPAASPLFSGHFPGRPILPGIAHLALAQRALSEILGREISLGAVRSLKLRRPVVPGDLPELRSSPPGEDGTVRFEVRCGETAASQGTVEIWSGPLPVAADGAAAEMDLTAAGFPPPESLLPHGPPALLLHAISEAAEDGVVAVAEIPLNHPLVVEGRFPAFLALEAAAQGAAALEALGRRGRSEASGPRIGYLVGIRDARFTVPSLPAGRRLRVTARLAGGAFPLSIYAVTLGEAGTEVATGTLSTFLLANS